MNLKTRLPNNFRLKRLASAWVAAAAVLMSVTGARAYVTYATNAYAVDRLSAWTLGTAGAPTDMHYELELQTGGPANRTLADGSTSWNQVIAAALTDWNQYLVGARFTWKIDGTAPVANSSNNFNTVSWSPDLFGEGWGSAIGITFRYFFINTPPDETFEADVFFNSNQTWDSYRGSLKFSATDLRRVALHEFGHSLGLDHPDDSHYGQSVAADMNAVVSNVDELTPDDIAGAQYLYNLAPKITTQPASVVATQGSNVTFTVSTANNNAASFQWMKGATAVTGATASTLTLSNVKSADAASYTVAITNRAGTTVSAAATLTVGGAVIITTQPQSQTVSAGAGVTLTAAAAGNGVGYQWLLNGTAIVNAISPSLVLSNVGALDAGSYTVQASNGSSTVTSNPAVVSVVTNARLVNLSTRAVAAAPPKDLVAGFVIGGSGAKSLLIRGVGPALAGFGVPGALTAATLTYKVTPVVSNSAWGGGQQLAAAFNAVGAFALPSSSLDAALLLPNVSTGLATAGVSPGNGAGPGIALVEVYDEDSLTSTARLLNLSSLGQTAPGANELAAGFFVGGSSSLTLLIRATGPALAAFGVSGGIAHPVLTVRKAADQTIVASNAGWASDPKIVAADTSSFAFPLVPGSADSAVVVTLAPGGYTANVSDANGASGIALVELYELR